MQVEMLLMRPSASIGDGRTGGVDPAAPPIRLLVGLREPREDQLAFCAALYEELVGVLPPEGATAESIASAAVGGQVLP
jgi:hypothetical protein